VKFSWADEYVYGIDFDNRLVKTAKVSAFFNGDGEATIIWGDGLDSLEHSEVYRGKLKETMPNKQDNGQFDILISNPPYSVDAFRRMLKNGAESFDLYSSLTDNSSEIECLFVERMKQLLKVGGWAGVILPSSILSNGGIYSRARDIIFKYFNVKAIVELGSGTFMETGTNTVILFLERRPNSDHEKISQAINTFFASTHDVTVSGIERAFSTYVANVYDDLEYEDYMSFISEKPSDAMRGHELYKDYIKEFGDTLYAKAFEVEKEKMLYFILTYNQNIVVAKSGQKQDEKAFLGYEFSKRRGYEGIKYLPSGTMLFDEGGDIHNPQKVNSYVLNAFLGNNAIEIDETIMKHVSYNVLSNFFEYGTSKFGRKMILSKSGRIVLPSSKFELHKLGELSFITKGQTITAAQTKSGNIPVVAGGKEPSVFHNVSNRESDIVTISASGANAGFVRYWDTPIFASDCNTVKSKSENVLTKYLYVCLNHLQSTLYGLQAGQAQPHVYEKDLREIKIPVPPLDVQHQIVTAFKNVSAEIDTTKERIEDTQKSIESKFLELFGDPISNHMGWSTKPIKNFATIKIGPFGSLLHATEYIENGIPIVNPSHIVDGHIVPDNKLTVSIEKYNDLLAYALNEGDIVLGRRGEIGRCAVVDSGKYLCGTGSMFIRIKSDYLPVMLQKVISSDSIRRVLESKAVGITMKNLNVDIIGELNIIVPPRNLQEQYIQYIEDSKKIITNYQKTLDDALKKRDGILLQYLQADY